MKRFVVALALAGVCAVPASGSAFAAQPGQMCQTLIGSNLGATPGQSANATGSPFNFGSAQTSSGISGGVYAGSGHAATMSGNSQAGSNLHAVSQYDVACSHQTP